LLLASVEDNEVADQVEQPSLVAQLDEWPVEERAGSGCRAGWGLVLPFHEELLGCARSAVTKPLRIAARQQKLHGAEEALIEDLLLIGNELAHPITDLDRAPLELDDCDRDAVEVEDNVGSPRVATFQRHFLSQREVVPVRVLPIDQVNVVGWLPGTNLHR